MTEPGWLTSKKPLAMLKVLEERARAREIDRKLLLYACSCVHRIWPMLVDERSRKAVEVVERYADGLATLGDVKDAIRMACEADRDVFDSVAFKSAYRSAFRDIHGELEGDTTECRVR